MTLAFFDFDGTITSKDSLIEFIKYVVGKPVFYCGLLSLLPTLICFWIKIIPNYIAKEKLITHFFKGWDTAHFQKVANRYSVEKIDEIVRPKALKRIIWHKEQGHKVVIVSASMECWLKQWCKRLSVDLIGTRLEIREGKLTGKFSTKNCHGKEKVNRIKERYDVSKYSTIYAYGDSSGDREMLSIATKPYFRYFE